MPRAYEFEIKDIKLGDLVVAVIESALETTGDAEQAYEIASRLLVRLLESSAPGSTEQLVNFYSDSEIQ